MTTLLRWCKFNVVGVMGAGVQLAALAVFNRVMAGHYLYASAAALEATLLHNFLWHLRYTWRDRRGGAGVMGQLVRFHLSNGFVSLLGNLVLMRVLVEGGRVPLLAANAVAIVGCSGINFWLSHHWTFTGGGAGRAGGCILEER